MWTSEQWRDFEARPAVRNVIFAVGVLLVMLSPLAGVIPGPGGLFVFAAGLALMLRTSMWTKRRYVHFKRWQPKAGRWADWGLRRESAKRREIIRKEQDGSEDGALMESAGAGDIHAGSPAPLCNRPATPGESARDN